jgi:signal peptidase II
LNNDNQVRTERALPLRTEQKTFVIALLTLLATVGADQLTKAWIWETVGPEGLRRVIDVMPGLKFIFVRNTGSAFGLFQGQSSILTVLTFVAIGFLGAFFDRNARQDPIVSLAVGLLIGGAIGNLIDRIRLGYVIDWIKVPHWPTFNIADSAITVGVTVLIISMLFRDLGDDRRDEGRTERGAIADGERTVVESGRDD